MRYRAIVFWSAIVFYAGAAVRSIAEASATGDMSSLVSTAIIVIGLIIFSVTQYPHRHSNETVH